MGIGDIFVLIGINLIGLIGLFVASGAHDAGMYIFGLVLFVFAVGLDFLLLKRHFDKAEQHG
jgi:hypothetical protein